ncbi:MAG TPA: UbiA family prenyltransferase, partial [Spongiibacteraceae bacterium]|nr:UbiA family prenyltransferase [Spongiibacteraceae bacterium]
YDTFYAMVDRDDDLKIGIKSTAILFGDDDRLITGFLQISTLFTLLLVGWQFHLGYWYYVALIGAAGLFAYQQMLIRYRQRDACFRAFLHNNWVGLTIFAGIALHYLLH